MGLRVAVANGNWSNPATWQGGIIPTATDVAATNGFVVNIDQDITVEGLTNLAHYPSAIPPMTYYDAPGGIVTSSGKYDATEQFAPWRAFNFSSNTSDSWIHTSGVPAGWLAYEFKNPKVINQYNIVGIYNNQTSSAPRDWTFEGWDGSGWIILHTVTGNTALSYIGTFTNTTAYKKYRINITANNGGSYTGIHTMYMGLSTDPTTTSVQNGYFTVSPGANITCTQIGLLTGAGVPLITINAAGNYYFNSNIVKNGNAGAIYVTAEANVYIVGDIISTGGGGSGATNYTLAAITYSKFYITGQIRGCVSTENNVSGCIFLTNLAEAYVTGNVTSNNLNTSYNSNPVIELLNGSRCEITGNVFHNNFGAQIIRNFSGILKIVGTVNATAPNLTGAHVVFAEYNTTGVNMLSGPFIFSRSGHSPTWVGRLFLIRTAQSYIEYMDNSGSGLLPPATQGVATRLVSPDTIADAPSPNNVRQGVSYSLGSLTGTMIVPSPDNVSKNIPVDNTVGTAVLDATAIWAVPLTSLNTSNSIGRRVKNAATVETTGAQIQATLNNNE
jgi:hypothetical protein